ncbi:hypothetical protein [Synechococcus sp. CC9311]|uniref:hypothetical protein n=1 Tax=Synechococcus sp. (strain CC9311) TaxID=64471 RepID=UPI0000DDB2A3|nr:hypothetical protein [Synechococcus sp. CC9311]ABI47125.1 hypothetical protein sync_2506 [Synechococcus sp. CC9311]
MDAICSHRGVSSFFGGLLGVIATSETQVLTPGEIGLPTDARLVQQLNDQETSLLNQP